MEIIPVADILLKNALVTPLLNALIPNADNYKLLALQPHGDIEASADGVRNRDRILATSQFGKFLEYAKQTQADIVLTPEYSMPWDVLRKAISAGDGPVQGKLWALGCESIKFCELESLKESLAPFATVIYEPLDANPTRFVSPLAYIFVSPPAADNGVAKTVMLVQFKTHAMGDPDHFEINGMLRGTRVYQFGGNEEQLKLVSLICADAFALTDNIASRIHNRALILHIQLNQNPRHECFLDCRGQLLRYNGDETEVLCLNWSEDVIMSISGHRRDWKNIAGSAWYLKSREFDDSDTTLCDNHRQGLYYTWLKPRRSHALFFNYKPAAFLFTTTKVAHIAVVGPVSRRRGPQLTKSLF
jgi:cytidine deaminase